MSEDNVIPMNGHAEPPCEAVPGDGYPLGKVELPEPKKEDPPLSIGARCLYQAALLIDGERAVQHGNRHENFENIAAAWSGYLGRKITAHDAAIMMALLKIARTKAGSTNRDDYIDAAGYIGLASEFAK